MQPLLEGKIRSAFAMTEPKVASSDATNIESSIVRDGAEYVINGHKWWTSGIGDPRCKVLIFMGKTDPKNPDKYKQQSMIVVPRDSKGITVKRMLTVFGYEDRKSTRLNSSHVRISYAVFCLNKKQRVGRSVRLLTVSSLATIEADRLLT